MLAEVCFDCVLFLCFAMGCVFQFGELAHNMMWGTTIAHKRVHYFIIIIIDDDDVELNVLGCRVDILGTNCDHCVSMVQCCFTIRLIGAGSPGRPPRLSHSS